jgi:hypothetical protein
MIIMESSVLQGPGSTPATAPMPPMPPGIPGAAIQASGAVSMTSLISQYTDGTMQLAGLKAQWDGLQSQLFSMRLDNPARAPVQQQAANVGVQIAQLEGQLAVLKAQIAARHGHVTIPGGSVNIGTMPWFNSRDIGSLAGLALLVAFLVPMSAFVTRRIFRARPAVQSIQADPMAAQRLERLEQAVDSVAIEVERISENQRFMTRVLVEKNPAEASGGQIT